MKHFPNHVNHIVINTRRGMVRIHKDLRGKVHLSIGARSMIEVTGIDSTHREFIPGDWGWTPVNIAGRR